MAGLIAGTLEAVEATGAPVRLLFSAHGLPLKIVARGDPYPSEVECTAAAVCAALARPGLDWRVCYQSRVGPLAWLGPSIDEEMRRAGRDGVAVVVAPISFVSEHSETLVELDRDYRHLAEACGVPAYHRVPTVGTDPRFIAALANWFAAPSNRRNLRATACRTGRNGRVSNILAAAYPWVKALHIIAVDRLDGGAALPAAAVCLSRRCADRVGPRGDAQGHGAAAVARHHAAGGGDGLWVRTRAGGDSRAWSIGSAAGSGPSWRWSCC